MTAKISTGEPATLGTYRKIALVLAGEGSRAVQFFDEKIAASPGGENEEVVADERQMMFLIGNLVMEKPTPTDAAPAG